MPVGTHRFQRGWLVYLPGALLAVCFSGLWFGVSKTHAGLVNDHEFVPIFDESGKRVGFTHPVLVDAANQVRTTQDNAKEKTH